MSVFWVRLFYLQVIKHDYYQQAALSDQLKEYQIPAMRGIIEAHSGDQLVPIVLNQKLYTVYADPTLVKDADRVADKLQAILGGASSDYLKKLKTKETRYVILGKKIPGSQKDKLLGNKFPGIGAQEVSYRIYPNGSLAAQLLGFVNNDGVGVYGIEQALNKQLAGTPGELKAVTDINGVPLAANTENVQVAPKPGDTVVLTIDMAMQQQLESILQQGLKESRSDSGSALIMDPNTGAIKAMANFPTYDPANYGEVEDATIFNNAAVSSPLEVGSVMKPLTTAAALDLGVVKWDTSYDDPAVWNVDGYKITNIEEDGPAGRRNVADILNLSLNTGATWLLMQMGQPGSTEITAKGRGIWYDYMTKHYRFGQSTGIEQGYEESGYIPDPNKGYGLDLTYANTTFGQGMTATPVQMGAAFSAVINGGTYYQPRLIDQTRTPDGKTTVKQPIVLGTGVVKPEVSTQIQNLLVYVVDNHYLVPPFNQKLYMVGGKTGTAQIAKPGGGYLERDFNGTYVGFVGGDKPEYVIVVRVNAPKLGKYAGSGAAQPVFGKLGHMLIDNFGVAPKSR
jgi:cell division protein FtsI/penicillin-binding protein 2